MAITRVKKSRKEYTCSKCFQKIPAGSEYLRGDLNFSKPIIRCTKCGLQSWEVTTSEYQLRVGEIVYNWSENYDVSEDGVSEMVSDLENIRDELQERLDNMPESLKDSDTGSLLQDRIDSVESAISDLESITFDEDDEELDEDHYSELIQDALNNIDV